MSARLQLVDMGDRTSATIIVEARRLSVGVEMRGRERTAFVGIEFDIAALAMLSPLFRHMDALGEEPGVYVFNEHLEAPDLCVIFLTRTTGIDLLEEITGRNDLAALQSPPDTTILATAEANIPMAGSLDDFLLIYGGRGLAKVLILESLDPVLERVPFYTFESAPVFRRNPLSELKP